jgi:acyl-CoA thioesterase FadM
MVLYFRMLWMFIKLYLDRSKVEPLAPFVRQFTVLPTDLDLFGHMNNSRYFSLMDIVRVEYFARSGFYSVKNRKKYLGFGGLLLARFRRQLKLGEKFHIIYEPIGCTEEAIYIDVKFVKNGYIHCHAIEKQMMYEHHKGILKTSQVFETIGHPMPEFKNPDYIEKLIEVDALIGHADKRYHEQQGMNG